MLLEKQSHYFTLQKQKLMQLHSHKRNRQPVTAQLAASICQKPNADAVETCQKKRLNSYNNSFLGFSANPETSSLNPNPFAMSCSTYVWTRSDIRSFADDERSADFTIFSLLCTRSAETDVTGTVTATFKRSFLEGRYSLVPIIFFIGSVQIS